jgi:hypothetical protein
MNDRILDKIISIIRNNLNEEGAMALPTNNVGSGNIAGTPEADPGNPPVRKRKRYIYQKNSRKLWRQG